MDNVHFTLNTSNGYGCDFTRAYNNRTLLFYTQSASGDLVSSRQIVLGPLDPREARENTATMNDEMRANSLINNDTDFSAIRRLVRSLMLITSSCCCKLSSYSYICHMQTHHSTH